MFTFVTGSNGKISKYKFKFAKFHTYFILYFLVYLFVDCHMEHL